MMFKGTKAVPGGQFSRSSRRRAARKRLYQFDYTAYFQLQVTKLPSLAGLKPTA
jgi:hypothetical protein